jgi:hypothetical protein
VTIEIREPIVDEAPRIRELIEAHSQAAFGETELSEEEIRTWFTRPKLSIRVAERDGRLAGYLDIYADESGRFPADIRTLDAEVAARLAVEAEALGRDQGAEAVRAFVQGEDAVMREVLRVGGWEPIRHSFQMRIDLDGDLPEPVWPDGLAARNPHEGEQERIYEANQEAFADHWGSQPVDATRWAEQLSRSASRISWSWVALEETSSEVVGYATNSAYQQDWDAQGFSEGWTDRLGVRSGWRGRGPTDYRHRRPVD